MSTTYNVSGPASESWAQKLAMYWPMSMSGWIPLLVALFVIFNIKTFPLFWHLRLLTSCRFTLRGQRPRAPPPSPSPSLIFQPIITSSTVQLMELDYNMHKSNSTYFADVDIARTHLICALFSRGIEVMRGGTGIYLPNSRSEAFGYGLGAVSCSFRREIKPYEDYEMWSRVLAWDEKWVYIVTHFLPKNAVEPRAYSMFSAPDVRRHHHHDSKTNSNNNGGGSNSSSSSSSSNNKDDSSSDDDVAGQDKFISVVSNGDGDATACLSDAGKHLYATALSKCVFKSGRKTVCPQDMIRISGLLPHENDKSGITIQDVEKERQRGLKVAHVLAAQNQRDLDAEFTGSDADALGKHSDVTGIVSLVDAASQFLQLKTTGM